MATECPMLFQEHIQLTRWGKRKSVLNGPSGPTLREQGTLFKGFD